MSKQTLVLLYGGRSAEREVSVLSAESVMRAVNYDKFLVKTYFITQMGQFIRTQQFSEKPSESERLMTNETIELTQKINQVISMKKVQLYFLYYMDLWEKMALSKVS